MGTVRVDRSALSPSTEYYFECDWISQDQAGNYSTMYIWLRAVNRGGTTSFSNYSGYQQCAASGVAAPTHSSTLPNGYAANATRWYDGPYGYNVSHDANGNLGAIGLTQYIANWHNSGGGIQYADGATLPAPARIPKPPTQPGTPVASNILPQSVQLDWTASTDNMGSAIDGYIVRRWDTADGSGPFVDDTLANTLTRTPTGLIPGKAYTFGILAHNGSAGGYSLVSPTIVVTTLAPARVKIGGHYKYGIPYVKVAGAYKVGLPFVKRGGTYEQPL